MDVGVNAKTEAKTFEFLISQLQTKVIEAREISQGFKRKAESLEPFYDDQGKADGVKKESQGYLHKLSDLIEDLDEINRENARSLNHLDKLL